MDNKILFCTILIIILCFIINHLINPKILKYKKLNSSNFIIKYSDNNSLNKCFYILSNRVFSIKRKLDILKMENSLILNNTYTVPISKKKFLIHISLARQPRIVKGPEDPRFFSFRDQIYIIYNDGTYNDKIRLFLFNLNTNKEIELKYSESQNIEKNWTPLIHKNNLYISYSINPHIILKVDMNDNIGLCSKIFSNKVIDYPHSIYGGTVFIYIPHINKFLSICHTYTKGFGAHKRLYYNIAVLVNCDKNFSVFKISKPFLFFENQQYLFPWKLQNVEYPIGLQIIENNLLISLGVDDIKTFLISYNVDDFLYDVFS